MNLRKKMALWGMGAIAAPLAAWGKLTSKGDVAEPLKVEDTQEQHDIFLFDTVRGHIFRQAIVETVPTGSMRGTFCYCLDRSPYFGSAKEATDWFKKTHPKLRLQHEQKSLR